MSGPAKVWPLSGDQRPAVDPEESVWLSASAGTGKTQVLSARVLRLLLQDGTDPSQLLCLTFTKAGAAEMAGRINQTLASWVRASPVALAADLQAIGADYGPAAQSRARTLFARVLDCPGGGLRIDTIHAFAQWLLATFPSEAGLTPGVRAMEDRDRVLLQREVLTQLLIDAETSGDPGDLLGALATVSLRMDPDAVQAWLLRCADAREAWFGTGSWTPPLRSRVEQLLGLPVGADASHLEALCADDVFDCEALRCCLSAYSKWPKPTGVEGKAAIAEWLAATPAGRLDTAEALYEILFSKKLTVKNKKSLDKLEEYFTPAAESVMASMIRIRELRAQIALADFLTPALEIGRAFALAWDAAKAREGLIDFDDQIRRAAELLGRSEFASWIRYKLDRRFDHILVDEAQDTNAAQWQIIDALTGDFFSGEGAAGDKIRTVFVVGDYKQAIFRFQGTSPENFEQAKLRVKTAMQAAAANARQLRSNIDARELQELGLDRSYRTAQKVLDFVNDALSEIGHESLGLKQPAEPHQGEERAGLVAFWRPVGTTDADSDGEADDGEDADEGPEGWLSRPDRQLADRIARQVRCWLDDGFGLAKGGHRNAGPGDIMVLVRKRKELAGLIVARLHAAGVPVAGVDRLRLGAPLAVRDVMAALRFAAQPLDDLNLASLLVSPLIGWSQEQLLEHGYRERGAALWAHLRRTSHPDVAAAMALLVDLLARADYEPPQALLHWLLTGPWGGRRKLVARLGREANDPLNELLGAAHNYAAAGTPSLLGFIHWFDAGDGELKREGSNRGGEVRVMTVHGAKGLQAPIVILADAAGNPEKSRTSPLSLDDATRIEGDTPRPIPLPSLRTAERAGRIREAYERAAAEEMQEHWRLLYVAMTRAEEALFITGSLGAREKAPAPQSWYARLEAMFPPDRWLHDPLWEARLEHGEAAPPLPLAPVEEAPGAPAELPHWLTTPTGPEPRPPRPLAPSALGEEQGADPPLPPGAGLLAARRGVLIHRLLERLPELPADARTDSALRWLARNAADLDAAAQAEIVDAARGVLADPAWAEIFGHGSLAEVPVAALVGDRVIAGTIDRLLVAPGLVRIVDFKTARRPPETLEDVPVAVLRQMAAYAAALEVTYPGRQIAAALLYTQAPRLITIPPQLLASHKQALLAPQETF